MSEVTAQRSRLVLIRHGESQWNAEGILQGQLGPGLTDRGAAEAAATAERVAREHPEAALLVASDLPRVTETAEPIAETLGLPLRTDARWRELDLGRWSGRRRDEVLAEEPDLIERWLRGEDVRRGGGETFAELRTRVCAAVDAVDAELADAGGGVAVIVTHGGPIRAAVAEVLGSPVGVRLPLGGAANCGITVLDLVPDRQLRGYNDCAHLLPVRVAD